MPSTVVARPMLLAAAGSHPGLQRENNEDRYHCDPQRGIFIVVDGVGGHAAGEKAAETALAVVRARLERETGSALDRLREAITLANNEILRLADSEPDWAGMACVLTVALVRDGRVTVGHVGDTRLYAFQRGVFAKVTHDHSPIGEREDQGELAEIEAMRHPRRNEIYRDVGSDHHEPNDADFIETLEFAFESETALLLCTDGLSDLVPSAELVRIIAQHARDPRVVVERLIEAANDKGGKDNVTAIFVAGPRFAEAVQRQGRDPGTRRERVDSRATAASGLVRMLSSRPAMLAFGVVAGLALATALLFWTDGVPDRVLRLARPASWARTWRVGPGIDADAATIGDALARAKPGDTVAVEAGSYELPITIPDGVSLVATGRREAVLAAGSASGGNTRGVSLQAQARISGFKIDASGLATGIGIDGEQAEADDLEVIGAREAAVVFGAGSRASLRSSYLHDNPGSGIVVSAGALSQVTHNVLSGNGKPAPAAPGAGAPSAPGAAGTIPAVVLQEGASAVFFGNIVAGNADDQIAGLTPDRRADVVRDNVIGLPPVARPAAPARPPAATPRRR